MSQYNKPILLQDYMRFCNSFVGGSCSDCPLSGNDCIFVEVENINYGHIYDVVTAWIDENPISTRLSEFLKLFPKVELADDKLPPFCPREFGHKCPDISKDTCGLCRRNFWLAEIETENEKGESQ